MGEAKRRGTFEQRLEAATKRIAAEAEANRAAVEVWWTKSLSNADREMHRTSSRRRRGFALYAEVLGLFEVQP